MAQKAGIEIILHFAEYHATMGGIYKSKERLISLAMRPLAPNLEEPTATDDGKVPSLVAESSVPIKDMASLT